MQPRLTSRQIWSRRSALVWRRIGDEAVILDPDRGIIRGVNLSAHAVWELLDGRRSLAEVARELAATYAITGARARADVLRFVGALARAALVERVA
jgi:hypothetical protein